MARIHDLTTVFAALADATRLRILGLLADGEVAVCRIHEALRLPQPTVSRHLAYLRRSGLVATRRAGTWVYYRLAELPDPVVRAAFSAAVHAVGHAPAARTDQERLDSCCNRAPKGVTPIPVVGCCGAGVEPES